MGSCTRSRRLIPVIASGVANLVLMAAGASGCCSEHYNNESSLQESRKAAACNGAGIRKVHGGESQRGRFEGLPEVQRCQRALCHTSGHRLSHISQGHVEFLLGGGVLELLPHSGRGPALPVPRLHAARMTTCLAVDGLNSLRPYGWWHWLRNLDAGRTCCTSCSQMQPAHACATSWIRALGACHDFPSSIATA